MVIQTRHPLQMELGARWSALPETVFERLYDPLSVGSHMNMCGRAGYRLDRLEGRAKGPYFVLEGCMVSKSIGGGLLGSLPAKPFTIWFDKAMLRAAEVSAKPEPEGNITRRNSMTSHPERRDPDQDPPRIPSFWRSRTGIYLIVALSMGGLLLGYEHRVHIFASDWVLWLPLLICVGMHVFMHGGHGGHGGHGSGGDRQ